MKVPGKCPWCEAPYIKVTKPEMNALLGSIYYECGTIVQVYAHFMHITTPCTPTEQWITHDDFYALREP